MKNYSTTLLSWSIYFGNILEHYDKALYGLLAPFLAPLFFPGQDPLSALALTYLIYPIAMTARPLGALVFGYIGDVYGRERALSWSLFGMTAATLMMGVVPVYADIGFWAPVTLAGARALQNFCAAGESVGGAVTLIETSSDNSRASWISSLFSASTIVGFLLASGAVTVLCWGDAVLSSWRYLYLGGASTAICGVVIRLRQARQKVSGTRSQHLHAWWSSFWSHRRVLAPVVVASGFSYSCFMIALVVMNGLAPLVADVTKEEMLSLNTALLLLDLALLPVFGMLALRINPSKLLASAAMTTSLLGVPLFALMHEASLATLIAIRVAFVVLGVWFSATYYAWAAELVDRKSRYTVLSLAYALGSQLLGAPTGFVSLWLYKNTGLVSSAAWYWVGLALVTMVLVRRVRQPTPAFHSR